MKFGLWDLLINILLFSLWVPLWKSDERQSFFNAYIGAADRAGSIILDFIEPVFFGMSRRRIASLALAFLLLFRAVLYRGIATSPQTHWVTVFGAVGGYARPGSLGSFITFSLISFGKFLFLLWGLSLIYGRSKSRASSGHAQEALIAFSRPFTFFKPEIRPFLLLAFGVALSAALLRNGMFIGSGAQETEAAGGGIMKLIVSAMVAWTDCLGVLLHLVIGLIIGSWVSMFTGSPGLASLCREWLDLFLGPARRFPLRIGMFDLAPIIFFFAVQFIYALLRGILLWSLASMPS